jgi:hypothetical protein
MLLLLFLISAVAEARDTPLAWQRIIHAGTKIDGDFFLSEEKTPEAELAAFLAEVKKGRNGNDSIACRFPARFRVAKELGLVSGERGSCPKFDEWRAQIRPNGIELGFASALVNSPSSLYGHTFLKFPRTGETAGKDLLDYSLSFGADTGNSGGLGYVWKGLWGGFDGVFSTAPFYLKVKEYGHMENRDLWIYTLDFTSAEVQLLADHMWELRNTKFPYFFLSRNCAYFLLEYLEAARPGLELTKHFPFWSIPIDAIRVLADANLIKKRERRESLMSALLSKRNRLNDEEDAWAFRVGENPAMLEQMPEFSPERRAMVADAAFSLFRYRRGVANENDPKTLKDEAAILKARGNFHPPAEKNLVTAPEDSHKSQRVGLSFGTVKSHGNFFDIYYRGALHDVLDPASGYDSHSGVAMGDFTGRWQNKKFILEQGDLLKIQSLAPRDAWVKSTAWNLTFGYDQAHWLSCEGWHCGEVKLDGGPGIALPLYMHGDGVLHMFLNSALRAGSPFQGKFQWDVGPTAGIFLPITPSWRVIFEVEKRISLVSESEAKHAIRGTSAVDIDRNSQVRMQYRHERDFKESALTYFRYF